MLIIRENWERRNNPNLFLDLLQSKTVNSLMAVYQSKTFELCSLFFFLQFFSPKEIIRLDIFLFFFTIYSCLICISNMFKNPTD